MMQSESVLLKCAKETYVQEFKYRKGKMTLQTLMISVELHAKA